jgi:chromate transporter
MASSDSTPSFSEFVRLFAKIGCVSFGGPAGQIALMHRELVDDRQWVDEQDFLHALNFCHLLPGPEAQQLATYIGWKLHGLRGGLAAGLLFVVPGALVMLALSALYVVAARADWFAAMFVGIKAAVLAIIVQALLRIGGRALDTYVKRGLALAAFIALAFFQLPFPLVVLASGGLGLAIAARRPDLLAIKTNGEGDQPPRPALGPMIATILGWGVIWALPLAAVWLFLGPDHVLWKIGLFFSQLAVVTFGGAYAVLAYMAQQAVSGFGWLTAGQMADGLGLAETTPGPLIMVTQFVGFLAAWGAPQPFTPWVAAILGALLTTWVTFAPCFLWIFTFAPWIDRLRSAKRLKGGLAAITAAVVGVIGSLAIWFAGHVLWLPKSGRPDYIAIFIALVAAFLLFRVKWSVLRVLIVSAGLGFSAGALGLIA